jgi:hypothetical protein
MRWIVLLAVVLTFGSAQAGDLLWPLPDHDFVTGGFADTRPDHFHGGVDLRTSGDNLPVVAPSDGWIERLSVTPPGYGRTVYFRLQDGRTAVFGHLSRFVPVLEIMLRDSEIAAGTYRVDCIYDSASPARTFHRGDTLCFTGKTGSGPAHLHFEIREGGVQTDPLRNFDRIDRNAPEIVSLSWISLSDFAPTSVGNRLIIQKSGSDKWKTSTVRTPGPVAFFIRTYDPGPWGRNAVPSVIRVKVDGITVYEVFTARIDLIGARDIYRRIVWGTATRRSGDTRRVFDVPPPPDFFDSARDGGGWLANLNNADVRVEVEDRSGNKSEVRLSVTSGPWPQPSQKARPAEYRDGAFVLSLQNDRAALWTQMEALSPSEVRITPGSFSFGDRLRLSACLKDSERLPGTFIYQRGIKGLRPVWTWPGTSADSLATLILHAGTYGIASDTEPPRLTLSAKQGLIAFRITDGLSGVDDRTMTCTVDGHTAIPEFEYEERGGTIWTQQPLPRGPHEVVFTGGDRAGNLQTWHETVTIR